MDISEVKYHEMLDLLERQNTIIENQMLLIWELMKLYSRSSDFHLGEKLEQLIRNINTSVDNLNK